MTTLIRRNDPYLFFKNFFDANSFFNPVGQCKFEYPVDIYEKDTGTGLIIEIAAIGIDSDDITIKVEEGNILRVSYQKDQEENDKKIFHKGITRKSFNFGWKIDSIYDIEKINATIDKGLLTLDIPYTEKTTTKQIKVNKLN